MYWLKEDVCTSFSSYFLQSSVLLTNSLYTFNRKTIHIRLVKLFQMFGNFHTNHIDIHICVWRAYTLGVDSQLKRVQKCFALFFPQNGKEIKKKEELKRQRFLEIEKEKKTPNQHSINGDLNSSDHWRLIGTCVIIDGN